MAPHRAPVNAGVRDSRADSLAYIPVITGELTLGQRSNAGTDRWITRATTGAMSHPAVGGMVKHEGGGGNVGVLHVASAASGNVCPGDDLTEPFVVGVVVAPDDVAADHAALFLVGGVVGSIQREVPQRGELCLYPV